MPSKHDRDRKRKRLSITISDDARATLKRLAAANGVSLSMAVETLIAGARAGLAAKP